MQKKDITVNQIDEEIAKNYTKDLLIRTNHKIQSGNNYELLMRDLTATLKKRKGSK